MSQKTKAILAAFAVLAVLLPAAVGAQTFARVTLFVKAPDGTPVVGAKITVTCAAITTFRKELTTNKKGKAILAVVDGTKLYDLKVEAEGLPTKELSIKPTLRASVEHEIVMDNAPNAAAEAATGGVNPNLLTPAQQSFNAGVEAAQAEDFVTAKAKFREAVERDDKLAYAHLALAGLQAEGKEWADAMMSVEKAIELDPNNIRSRRLAYDIYIAAGEEKKAKETLSILSKIDSSGDSAAMVFNEGVTAFKVGDNVAARTSFEKALEMQGDLTAAMRALTLIYFKQGEHQLAIDMAERFLTHEPENVEIIRMRYDIYRAIGNKEKEAEAFQALAAVDPATMVVELFNEGARFFEAGQTAQAQANFEKVLTIDPNHARSHYQLGICLVGSDPAQAKVHLEKFLELAPDDAEAGTAKEMLSYLQ